jgi:hypothetical protein
MILEDFTLQHLPANSGKGKALAVIAAYACPVEFVHTLHSDVS